MKRAAWSLAVVMALAAPAFAASEADFKAAYAAAEKAEQQAMAVRNAWTVTETALKDAQRAAAAEKYDEAVELAKHAEALAEASLRQEKEQRTAWRAAVVH